MTKRSGTHGFTLVELLISITLLGLLLVLLFGGLHFGVRAWERTTTLEDSGQTHDVAQSLLRRELERVCVRLEPAADPRSAPPFRFDGTSERIRFLAPVPSAVGHQRCAAMTLTVNSDGATETLVLSLGEGAQDVALLRGARDVRFSYLRNGYGWREDWHREPELPALIRIRASLPQGDARTWPELFIAPRLSASPDCNYDAAIGACKGN